jgi:ribosomal protein S18 acetylase RimI-like enzyme
VAAGVVVRRVSEDDWRALRAVRLEMLADTPLAYLETVASAEARSEGEWRFRARRGSAGSTDLGLAAEPVDEPGRWVGYLACFVDAPGQGHVVSVYVASAYRGTGLASEMLDAVRRWATHEAGLNRLHLFVHEHNGRAAAFYRRYGFTPTGYAEPYELDRSTSELELAMLLEPPDGARGHGAG